MRVACIGECMVELTLPREEGGDGRVGFAGDTLNAAVYLKRSAPEIEVSYVTALGTDPLSARMLGFFTAEGLDTGLVERRGDRVPGLYAISLDERGERSFTYWRDSSAARTLFLPPAEVTPDRLSGFDLVYLSGITLAILAPEARRSLAGFLPGYRRAGGRVAFDSNYRPRLWSDAATARKEIDALWALTDVGLPSLDDEMALHGDTDAAAVMARLAAAGVRRGALKRGPEGPLPLGPVDALPAFPPAARVVDTTAAGDSFNGGYLAAMMRGRPEADCLAAGHAMAAEVVGYPGAIIPRARPATIG
ncbi:MAG: sugar kinase [Amaricoccus sp.]